MAMRELIVSLFPLEYEKYIEVFGGAAWVLFHKEQSEKEVYNDFNSLLVNLFRFVRDDPEILKKELKYSLNSREDFIRIRNLMKNAEGLEDSKKAAYFYELIRYSYASGLTSYGGQPHDMHSNFELIDMAHARIRKVVIENKDFQNLMSHFRERVAA